MTPQRAAPTSFQDLRACMPLAPWRVMRALVRWLLVVLVVLGCVGCVYSRKKQVGTNLPPGDLGGPWTKGEQTGGGGGGPAFTPDGR